MYSGCLRFLSIYDQDEAERIREMEQRLRRLPHHVIYHRRKACSKGKVRAGVRSCARMAQELDPLDTLVGRAVKVTPGLPA